MRVAVQSGIVKRFATRENLTLLILFSGVAAVIALADRAPIDLESITADVRITEKFLYYWQGVVFRFFPGPYVYRIFVPYLLWGLNRLIPLDLITLDLILKTLLLIAVQFAFYRYLLHFAANSLALLGVFVFDAYSGYLLSFIKGPSVIETIDLLNVLILTLGLTTIYRRKPFQLSIVLLVGLLNRETPLLLILIYFVHEWLSEKNWWQPLFALVLSLVVFVGVRLVIPTWAAPTWFNLGELATNLPFTSREATIANLRLLILLGPLAGVSLYRFSEHPRFLKIPALAILALIPIHYVTARVIEARLWMPLFPFLIPLAVNNLGKLLAESPQPA